MAEEEQVMNELRHDAYFLESLQFNILSFHHYFDPNAPGMTLESEHRGIERVDQNIEGEWEEKPKQKFRPQEHFLMPAKSKFVSSLWLSQALGSQNFVLIYVPKWFQQPFIFSVLSGPESYNLRDKNAHFFTFGSLLTNKLKQGEIQEAIVEIYF